MSTLGEVEDALSVLAYGLLHTTPPSSLAECRRTYSGEDVQDTLQDRVVLLHCTSEYPAPVDTIQLRAMDTLRRAFDLRVGYSDHTEGIAVPTAAVARGAVMIEKHFTLDRSLPGPDHRASLEPDELTSMVASIRRTEAALGTGRKQPRGNEWGNRTAMRRSLVAARPISEGTVLTEDDVAIKRQGDGLSPMRYWEVLGTEARRDFAPDAPIAPQSVE
jgi:N-acetylneuraminate synthase